MVEQFMESNQQEPDFLVARSPQWGIRRVWIAGRAVTISRPTFGRYLATLALHDHMDSDVAVSLLSEATGLSRDELDEFSVMNLAILWAEYTGSMRLLFMLPFMRVSQPGGPDPADYKNRWPATIIHQLAKAYGWTKDQIESLFVEEVFCLLHEIVVDEHRQREWEYTISDVGYDKSGRKQPYPQAAWMSSIARTGEISQVLGGTERRSSSKPPVGIAGTVVDLEQLAKSRRESRQ